MNTPNPVLDGTLPYASGRSHVLWQVGSICLVAACMPFIPGRTPFPVDVGNVVSVCVLVVTCALLLSGHFRRRQGTLAWNILTAYLLTTLALPFFLILARMLLHGHAAGPDPYNVLLWHLSKILALPLLFLCVLGAMFAICHPSSRRSTLFWAAFILCVTITWSVRLSIAGWYRTLL